MPNQLGYLTEARQIALGFGFAANVPPKHHLTQLGAQKVVETWVRLKMYFELASQVKIIENKNEKRLND